MNAFLGMGLLGSNFVRAMLKRNEPVQVWNRTETKAKALEEFGAKSFKEIADAVKNADIIHVTLKDDTSVDEVLQSAIGALKKAAVIIDHTTTSAGGAVKRTQEWKSKGYTYVHAPVFMGPQNALEGTGFMLISGDKALINRLEPLLSKMTGKLINFGTEEGKAAAIKLMGNLFLLTLTAGISDTLAFAKGLSISNADISTLFDAWNPGAAMPARLKRIATGKFDEPSWELSMARKDAGLMMDAAKQSNAKLAIIPTIAAEMDKWIAKGFGNYDWSVIAKDSVS
jgi:3-hydroxyisobutyrate dehydrogenase